MNKYTSIYHTIALSFLSLFVIILFTHQSVQGMPSPTEDVIISSSGQKAIIVYAPGTKTVDKVAPPQNFLLAAAATADIQVNYSGSWTAEAQNAFEYAVGIWETQIVSTVPIEVDAEFKDLGSPCILGQAGAENNYANFPGAPMANTFYPVATANALAGSDLFTGAEIGAQFNSNLGCGTSGWYFGTDGNTPSLKVDFVSVVLHEIGHGLGFFGSMTVSGSRGYWGLGPGLPTIYDRYTENSSGQSLLDFSSGSSALATQLTSGGVYFDAPNANAANGGRVPLYAPSSWESGSSYSHLAESFNGTSNSLMTYQLGDGESEHNPGPVVLGMFEDMGWTISSAAPTAPTVSGLPMIELSAGQTFDNVIDLWAYTTDDVDSDADLSFAVLSQSDPIANVTIDSNRFIDINPTKSDWEGVSAVTIRATDTDSLYTDVIFIINPEQIYLPVVQK